MVPDASQAIEPATRAVIEVETSAQRPSLDDITVLALRVELRHCDTRFAKRVVAWRGSTSSPLFCTGLGITRPAPLLALPKQGDAYSLTIISAVNRYRRVNCSMNRFGTRAASGLAPQGAGHSGQSLT